MLHRIISVVALVFTASCASTANNDNYRVFDVIEALNLTETNALGVDAIRFSTQPALGGASIIVSVSRLANEARVDVHWAEGHPHRGWRQTGNWSFFIQTERYLKLASAVDARLARGEPSPVHDNADGSQTITLCSDGPGYRTERVSNNEIFVLNGFCGAEHPNNDIAEAILELVSDQIGPIFKREAHI